MPDHGWTCFHCGETFSIARQRCLDSALKAAREHFGSNVTDEPLCKIGTLPHAELVRRVRAAEDAAAEAQRARDEADAEAEVAQSELSSLGHRFKGAKTVYDAWCMFESMEGRAVTAEERVHQLEALINTPQTADYFEAVRLEAAHQQERWGAEHDAGKAPQDWFWLIGYLAGKALHAFVLGDLSKGRHHIISSGAALLNWHRQSTGEMTAMRPGIAEPTT